MIIFKYSLESNKNMIEAYKGDREFCMKHNIVWFEPSRENMLKAEEFAKTNKTLEHKTDITCYVRYWGPWGMYHPEDKCISICPIELERCGGLKALVDHELSHLEHPEADSMSFVEKESYINKIK